MLPNTLPRAVHAPQRPLDTVAVPRWGYLRLGELQTLVAAGVPVAVQLACGAGSAVAVRFDGANYELLTGFGGTEVWVAARLETSFVNAGQQARALT